MPTALRVDRSVRASEAIEFALTLPMLLLLVSGVVDFGWYSWQQSAIQDATRHAARVGAATEQSAAPLGAATEAARRSLTDSGMSDALEVRASFLTDPTGDQLLSVEVSGPYVGLWTLVDAPYELRSRATMRMEDQPER